MSKTMTATKNGSSSRALPSSNGPSSAIFEIYSTSGYKQTELGSFPQDWNICTCESISVLVTVGIVIRPTQYYVEQGVAALRSANVREKGIDISDMVFISNRSNVLLAKSQVRAGDVLTVRTGYPGTSAVVPAALEGSNCIDIIITRPSKGVNSNFLAAWINSQLGKDQVLRNQGGLAQQHFNVGDLKKLLIALPPFSEQEAIAEALSDADALIEALEQMVEKKRLVKQSAMQDLISGSKRLEGYSEEWQQKRFDDLITLRKERIEPGRVRTHDFCIDLEHIEQGSGQLIGNGVTNSSFSSKSVFYEGDVLFGKLRAYLRKYWRATREGVCSTEIWVMAANRDLIVPDYLFQLIQLDKFIETASTAYGTHMPRSDWNVVRNYDVVLPSMAEQSAIASILSDMDAEIAALETKLAKYREIKQGMMQNLLTGRIRLV